MLLYDSTSILIRYCRLLYATEEKTHVLDVVISKLYKYSSSQPLSQQSAAMGSSKQLPSTLTIKIVDAHKTGEGYKKIDKRFQVAVPSVRFVITK